MSGPVTVGMIVAAIFPEDQGFYRARITRVDLPEIHVHYIDYGNFGIVKWEQIFKLADQFTEIPAQEWNMPRKDEEGRPVKFSSFF